MAGKKQKLTVVFREGVVQKIEGMVNLFHPGKEYTVGRKFAQAMIKAGIAKEVAQKRIMANEADQN